MMTTVIAVDIGATNVRVAAFADDAVITRRSHRKTPRGGGADAIVKAVVEMIHDVVQAGTEVGGICIGVPAPVDAKKGRILEVSNLPELADVCLVPLFRAHLSAPLYVRNDAALAALGEHRHGAGRGTQNMVYVTISTGIGGGVIIDGQLVSGAGGYAGEVGELLVPGANGDPVAPVSLENVASGSAIAAAATRALDDGEESVLRDMAANAALTSRMVADAARDGDRMALRILHRAATCIGFALVDILHLLNPERLVLGGGVMESADLFKPIITEIVDRFAMKSSLRNNVKIVFGELGDDAGLIGGAAFLRDIRGES